MRDVVASPSRDRGRPETAGDRLPIAARRDPLVATVESRLRRRCGVAATDRLVVGVSGGADSVALLLAMTVLRNRTAGAPTPVAVHVHHHLRGDEADGDATFVATLCAKLDVPLRIEHVHPHRESGNLAARARDLRYAALRRIAAETDARHVAVAHHGDDQLETMLMALCRGAGLAGLGAMTWTRPLDEQIALVRPLLGVRRVDCESMCRAAASSWREDASNDDPNHARGRLRRDVLPVLETLWPDAARRVTVTAESAAAAHQLEEILLAAFGPPDRVRWERATIRTLPTTLIAAGLRRAFVHVAPEHADAMGQRLLGPAAEAIADDDDHPRRFDWPNGWRLEVDARQVRLGEG